MAPMVRIPMTTELALLGFLNEQPMHGYEIHRRMSDPKGLGQVWHIKQSQLYSLLGKLEDAGYITSILEAQDSKPPRKIYRLSATGRSTYTEWLKEPVDTGRRMRLEFLVKFYFALAQGQKTALDLVKKQKTVCNDWLVNHQEMLKETSDQDTFNELIFQYRTGQIKAMLAWLEACEHSLAIN